MPAPKDARSFLASACFVSAGSAQIFGLLPHKSSNYNNCALAALLCVGFFPRRSRRRRTLLARDAARCLVLQPFANLLRTKTSVVLCRSFPAFPPALFPLLSFPSCHSPAENLFAILSSIADPPRRGPARAAAASGSLDRRSALSSPSSPWEAWPAPSAERPWAPRDWPDRPTPT